MPSDYKIADMKEFAEYVPGHDKENVLSASCGKSCSGACDSCSSCNCSCSTSRISFTAARKQQRPK